MPKEIRRGKERVITCDICGQRQPKSHTRPFYRFGKKFYACMRCAKKMGLVGRYARIKK
ncbi:MAG: hypothetical protein QW507_01125 [Candidatus Nanoarchaeia archaeon]|nr:hypothetical protein [Candidatus Haiyanarchaeum thermophilum]MCW1303417.1 hypothetical protein [Candidatus Haiyanarchaeum thermophilum]MCW1303896.1 hypothetical protein [Candidatus Haiyanarchaeum thermophilum]MCW1306881.1 hypothetical protein [Candidatus Haiyanarchaeum thermophilum]MCW1307443.1 hypothetical protein [Candidatus Haiyanarchaeum thermophilum]